MPASRSNQPATENTETTEATDTGAVVQAEQAKPEAAPESPIESSADATPLASDTDKAEAAATVEAAFAAHPHKGQFLQYLGPRNAAAAAAADEYKKRAPRLGEGTTAEITPVHWKQHGIESKRTHTWNLANNWRIPATQLTVEQIEYLLTNSKRFELVDRDGQKVDAEADS